MTHEGTVVHDPAAHWQVPRHAEHYERGRFGTFWGRLYRFAEERRVARVTGVWARGSRVLDAACGTGRISALLRRDGFAVVGCDVSRAMMLVGQRQIEGVDFLQSNAAFLPFADDSFDAVTCFGLLMHLEGPTRIAVLRELRRVSRGPLLVQYGRATRFVQLLSRVTRQPPGHVRHSVVEAELRRDLEVSELRELGRFPVLRPLSSSLILLLDRMPSDGAAGAQRALSLHDAGGRQWVAS